MEVLMDTGKDSVSGVLGATPPVVEKKKEGALKRLFGQFARAEFWEEVFALLAREAIAALLSAIGGTLVTVAASKRSEASARVRDVLDKANGYVPQNSPSAAFSGGFTPKSSYKPSTLPNGVAPSDNPPFPGF